MDAIRAGMKAVRVPGPRDAVFKDECMFSFDRPESPGGLYLSLSTWRSYGVEFVKDDFEKHGNPLYLKLVTRRVVKPVEEVLDADDEGKEKLPSKLAIGVEGGFQVDAPKYDEVKKYFVVALPDLASEIPAVDNPDLPEQVSRAVDAVIAHDGVNKTAQIAAQWEEEDRKESRFAADLPHLNNGKKISPDPKDWSCEESGMTENLWLNLSSGHIGSGRRNFDGSGGTGAALKHYEDTGRKYPLAVKLGTITPHGADVYSYAPGEDDMVLDSKLAEHLARWGINMQLQEKTEKTVAELQIEANASHEWGKLTESGADLVSVGGPGYVGLENLGNSCYMNSVLQLLFALPILKDRYVENSQAIVESAPEDPSDDLITMLSKVGVGLLTNRNCEPVRLYDSQEDAEASMAWVGEDLVPDEKSVYESTSVRPSSFKAIIGKGHVEFGTARQQDAGHFFQHLLEVLSRAEHTGSSRIKTSRTEFIPTASLFQIDLEDRILCEQSGKVRYVTRSENVLALPIPVEAATNKHLVDEYEDRKLKKQKMDESSSEDDPVKLHVPFDACLGKFIAPEVITGFQSPATGVAGSAQKRTRIRSFPEFLIIQMSKYYVGEDWTPKKLDVCVPVPEILDLERLRGVGLAEDEELLPDDGPPSAAAIASAPAVVQPDADIVAQVVAMGFSENGAKRATVATGNMSAEASMNWVLSHMEDPDFNDPVVVEPIPATGLDDGGQEPSTEDLGMLTAMGFTIAQASFAFKATSGNLERAADWLFSHADDLDAAIASAQSSKNESQAESTVQGVDGPGTYELVGFASHMGSNTACGHYVAHVKKEGRFVLYNDEKVAVSQAPPLGYGFVYLYQRKVTK